MRYLAFIASAGGGSVPSSRMDKSRRELVAAAGWLACASLAGCAAPGRDARHPSPSLVTDVQAGEAAFLALGLVGVPYRYGGNTPEGGFDCSGLIGYVYWRAAGMAPPRTVAQLSRWGRSVKATDLRAGDLVIFGEGGSASHAAIHAGESRFVHAPSTGGTVRLNALQQPYWASRLLDFRRA